MPRREGMERKDLLKANVKIFKSQGSNIDKFAKKTVKVLVVGKGTVWDGSVCLFCSIWSIVCSCQSFAEIMT